MSYILTHGAIPDGLFVLHRCDNPSCINPDHLFLGTHADNMADRNQKGRTAKGDRVGPKKRLMGVNHYLARFTEDQIRDIRRRYIPRKFPTNRLAQEYGVTDGCIHSIVKRKSWKHIEQQDEDKVSESLAEQHMEE